MPYVDGLPFLVAGALLIINAVQQFSAKAEVRWAQTTCKTVEFRTKQWEIHGKIMGFHQEKWGFHQQMVVSWGKHRG